jgi:hypothetical protein
VQELSLVTAENRRNIGPRLRDVDSRVRLYAAAHDRHRQLAALTKVPVPSWSRKPQNYRTWRLMRNPTNHDGANNANTSD